jgi:hypothetical protein
MKTFPSKLLLFMFLPCLVTLLLFNSLSSVVSAQEDFNIVIGRDKAFSTYNIHNTQTKTPVNHTTQGRPRILDASSEGEKASAHVYSETFQEGLSEAWVGVSLDIKKTPLGKDTGTAEISVSVRYELDVDFEAEGTIPYVYGGGSADTIFFAVVGEEGTMIDRIHYIHYGDSSSKSGTEVYMCNVTLRAGQTINIFAHVYAYGDVYQVGYADSHAEVVLEEIRVHFVGKDQGLSSTMLQTVAVGVGTATGAAAVYQVFYRGRPPSSNKIEERLTRRKEDEVKLEEEKKKRTKSKKGEPDLTWTVKVPTRIIGTTPSEAVVEIQNRGQVPAEGIEIRVTSSPEVTMIKRFETIGRLGAGARQRLRFPFNMGEHAKKGIYHLRFDVKSKQTPQQTKKRHLRLMKIGILSTPGRERYVVPLKEWLRSRGYSWSDLTSADDFFRLLRYDLLILAPEIEATPRWIRNISNFVENGQSLVVFDKVTTPEKNLLARTLGYESIQYETFKSGDGTLTIVGEEHPATRGYTKGEIIPIDRAWGNACTSNTSTGKILAVQRISGEKGAKLIPAITANSYGRGKTLHLNFHAEDSTVRIDRILKTAFDWLFFTG